MKDTKTGDTLWRRQAADHPRKYGLPRAGSRRIEPKTKVDQDKMAKASARCPTRTRLPVPPTKRPARPSWAAWRVAPVCFVDAAPRIQGRCQHRQPQVAYRETITQAVKNITYTHKKQTGGSGQYAEVTIDVEPLQPGESETSYEFVDKITGGRIPREYIPAVNAGAKEAITTGVLAGYPVENVRVTLTDGKYHDVDSSELAFKIAGIQAMKEGMRKAKPCLLEPIMAVEVVTPDDFMGEVMGDLSRRRGKLGGQEAAQQQGDHRPRPVVRDVRLRYRPAFADPGPCDVHDAVRLVSADACLRARGDRRPRSRRVTDRLIQ